MSETVLSKGTLFPVKVTNEVFSKVKGKSTLAKLSQQIPISFNGNQMFTFSADGDVNIVAESGKKPANSISLAPVTVQPIKVVYQARVTDEFMYAAEEEKINILAEFIDAMAKKFAVGLDKMGMHGVNPATGIASSLITSYIGQTSNTVRFVAGNDSAEAAIGTAISALDDYDVSGIAVSKVMSGYLASETYTDGRHKFPELQWGGQPGALKGIAADVNKTVSNDLAIVGDFSMFRWGYSKDIKYEVIEYGDPDGAGTDLKNVNQVLLRAEAYIGFVVLDPAAFTIVKEADALAYDANGGTGTMSATVGMVGENVKVAANTFTPPENKVFSKWNTNADGSGTDYSANDDYELSRGTDKLYAIWEAS